MVEAFFLLVTLILPLIWFTYYQDGRRHTDDSSAMKTSFTPSTQASLLIHIIYMVVMVIRSIVLHLPWVIRFKKGVSIIAIVLCTTRFLRDIYYILFTSVLDLILTRTLQALLEEMEQRLQMNIDMSPEEEEEFLSHWKKIYSNLEFLTDAFGTFLVMTFGVCLMLLAHYFTAIIIAPFPSSPVQIPDYILLVLLSGTFGSAQISRLVLYVRYGHRLKDHAKNVSLKLKYLSNRPNEASTDIRELQEKYSNVQGLSAGGFFTINRNIAIHIIGALASYLFGVTELGN